MPLCPQVLQIERRFEETEGVADIGAADQPDHRAERDVSVDSSQNLGLNRPNSGADRHGVGQLHTEVRSIGPGLAAGRNNGRHRSGACVCERPARGKESDRPAVPRHGQDVHKSYAIPRAAHDVGRHRNSGQIFAHVVVQQLLGRRPAPAVSVPHGDVPRLLRLAVHARVDARASHQHHPFAVHVLEAVVHRQVTSRE